MITLGLIALIGLLLAIQSFRRARCEEAVDYASRESARRACEGYQEGLRMGSAEAERHYFDWIGKRGPKE